MKELKRISYSKLDKLAFALDFEAYALSEEARTEGFTSGRFYQDNVTDIQIAVEKRDRLYIIEIATDNEHHELTKAIIEYFTSYDNAYVLLNGEEVSKGVL